VEIYGTLILLWAATLVTVILLLLERLDNPVGAGAAFSLSLTFIGMGLGFFMTLPTPEQNAALVAGQPLLHIGAHSVGVKDGGPGIPVLYLSTQGGDMTSSFAGYPCCANFAITKLVDYFSSGTLRAHR